MLPMTFDPSNEASTAIRYAYRPSLIGAAHQFELTEEGLSWRIAGKSGVWPYAGISAIRLSYRPVSMQSRRFRADIDGGGRGRIVLLSTSWQTAALMAPQDRDYRVFNIGAKAARLHRHRPVRETDSRDIGIGPDPGLAADLPR